MAAGAMRHMERKARGGSGRTAACSLPQMSRSDGGDVTSDRSDAQLQHAHSTGKGTGGRVEWDAGRGDKTALIQRQLETLLLTDEQPNR